MAGGSLGDGAREEGEGAERNIIAEGLGGGGVDSRMMGPGSALLAWRYLVFLFQHIALYGCLLDLRDFWTTYSLS